MRVYNRAEGSIESRIFSAPRKLNREISDEIIDEESNGEAIATDRQQDDNSVTTTYRDIAPLSSKLIIDGFQSARSPPKFFGLHENSWCLPRADDSSVNRTFIDSPMIDLAELKRAETR